MADVTNELLKTQLRQLRLPTMGREFDYPYAHCSPCRKRSRPSGPVSTPSLRTDGKVCLTRLIQLMRNCNCVN